MAYKYLKIIIDTNLWISFLITKSYNRIDDLIIDKKIRIVFSEELLSEFIEVIQRPELAKYFTKNDLEELLELFDFYGDFIEVKSRIKQCRDPKDNFLLSLAIDSKTCSINNCPKTKAIQGLKKNFKTNICSRIEAGLRQLFMLLSLVQIAIKLYVLEICIFV